MVTIPTLHDAVCDFLEEHIASRFQLKSVDIYGATTQKKPQIVRSGWILPKSIDDEESDEEEFPYILPRVLKAKGIQNARESIVELQILFGIYDPGSRDKHGRLIDDGSGYRDFWNLVEATRQALFHTRTLDDKFRIHDDYFEAQLVEEQIYPYWEGYCITRWDVAYPHPQLEESFF